MTVAVAVELPWNERDLGMIVDTDNTCSQLVHGRGLIMECL